MGLVELMEGVPLSRQLHTAWLIAVLIVLYGMGYGAARWRKLLVRGNEFAPLMAPPGTPRTFIIIPGHDPRSNSVGNFKNSISGPVAVMYTPLRWMESQWWNARVNTN